jgi:hypothetical protein
MQRSDSRALRNRQTRINPIQLARVNRGYTQDDLAAVARKSFIFIQHLESGLLPNVPNKILQELDIKKEDYYEWCLETRQKNSVHLLNYLGGLIDPWEGEYGYWLAFRKKISDSKIGFCKLYCLHPQILATFEGNVWERSQLTPGMRSLFIDAGVGRDAIAAIDGALLNWKG